MRTVDKTGVETTERGAIAVDERGRTNVEGVYAIGDVTAKMMLAHVAEAMGTVAAETIRLSASNWLMPVWVSR